MLLIPGTVRFRSCSHSLLQVSQGAIKPHRAACPSNAPRGHSCRERWSLPFGMQTAVRCSPAAPSQQLQAAPLQANCP